MPTLIRHGTIVTAGERYRGDVYIDGETVCAVGDLGGVDADLVIDATDKLVLPGCIDPHVHLETPSSGTVNCDDFTTGTVAAAHGGNTTILHFCLQLPGEDLIECLESWHERLRERPPIVDIGFHMIVTDLSSDGNLERLARLPDEGVPSFKLFMANRGTLMVDDATLFEAMQVAAATRALTMVHAENGGVIDVLVRQAVARGDTGAPWHALTRPCLAESEATHRAIELAHLAGSDLYVVHVSCAEAAHEIALAQGRGRRVWAETCTQYLFVDPSGLEEEGIGALKYVFSPPPRPREHHEQLWSALAQDVLCVVSSDHSPFRVHDQKTIGGGDFSRTPNGAPGIEHRLAMIHHFGVSSGRISYERMVDLLSTRPARLFGLYPRKGTIAPGSDADIVVFDPKRELTISAATDHSTVDYSLYEGTTVFGAPEVVLLRGRVIVENDRLVAQPGYGEFVARARVGDDLPCRLPG